MKNLDKVISVLDLASSDTRDDSIDSIIESVLYSYGDAISITEMKELIQNEYLLSLHDTELEASLDRLLQREHIDMRKNKYFCVEDRIAFYNETQRRNSIELSNRKDRFFSLFADLIESSLCKEDKDAIWETFNNYIFECFYKYGRNTVKSFMPLNSDGFDDNLSIQKKSIDSLPSEDLRTCFTKVIRTYSNRIDTQELKYLESLAKKVEAFYSLGFDEESYKEFQNFNVLELKILVDTNFLYSILDLHIHPERESCKAIVRLINERGLNIKLMYLPDTLAELLQKKQEFDNIPKTSLTPKQIKALLESETLDSFLKSYYEQLLLNPNDAPHPSDRITYAKATLTQKNITLFNAKLKVLREDSKLLEDRYSEYSEYLRFVDETRAEKGFSVKGMKEPEKIEHDVLLREVIDYLRPHKRNSFTDAQYFGLTLDNSLMNFDKFSKLKTQRSSYIPTFLAPSFLLQRLLRILPLLTEDYHRAFIAAISSPTFDSSRKKALTTIRTVGYFKNMGIEDDQLILKCITDKLFINEIENKQTSEEIEAFIASTVEKHIQGLKEENDVLSKKLVKHKEELLEHKHAYFNVEEELDKKNIETSRKEDIIKDNKEKILILERELQKIRRKRTDSKDGFQLSIPLSAEQNMSMEHQIDNVNEKKDEQLIRINWKLLYNYIGGLPKWALELLKGLNASFVFIFGLLAVVNLQKTESYTIIAGMEFLLNALSYSFNGIKKKTISYCIVFILSLICILVNLSDIKKDIQLIPERISATFHGGNSSSAKP